MSCSAESASITLKCQSLFPAPKRTNYTYLHRMLHRYFVTAPRSSLAGLPIMRTFQTPPHIMRHNCVSVSHVYGSFISCLISQFGKCAESSSVQLHWQRGRRSEVKDALYKDFYLFSHPSRINNTLIGKVARMKCQLCYTNCANICISQTCVVTGWL